MALQKVEQQAGESRFEHRVVEINRVSRTVKGGRRFRFRATVIVGDKRGTVGLGVSKGADVQQAIVKAQESATKNLTYVPLVAGSIPHEQHRKFCGSLVILKPAPEGSGIIAGSTIRAVAELAGINDISSKVLGSSNKLNVVHATLQAFELMKDPKDMKVNKKVEEQVV